jgi:hypothetical protein
MDRTQTLENDLKFVSQTVRGAEDMSVPAIYFLWGVITLIGYSLIDLKPELAGPFWAVASPLGTLLSFYFGRRQAKATGQLNRERARRHTVHWGATLTAIFMTGFLVHWGFASEKGQSLMILLILAFSYITAGSYLDKNLRWLGVLIGVSFFPMALYGRYMWTGLGLVFGGALIVTALLESRKNARFA